MGNPLNAPLPSPNLIRRHAEQEWAIGRRSGTLSEENYLRQEEAVFEYELRHDLAHSLKGATLPSVFIAREDADFVLASTTEIVRIAKDDLIHRLTLVGDNIAERLRPLSDDVSASRLLNWEQRWPKPSERLVSSNTTLSIEVVNEIGQGKTLQETWELPDEKFEENELLAAARMAAGSLSSASIVHLLDSVRFQPRIVTRELDALSDRAIVFARNIPQTEDPHRQGRRLAQWLREQHGVVTWENNHSVVHPNMLLDRWRIPVIDISLAEPTLEGVGIWGKKHGPMVLINRTSPHAKRPTSRRAILSHEICHLLIDRSGALPLAEVMEGRIRPVVEQRARAFGAELLLPTELVERNYVHTSNIPELVNFLSATFGASYEICAWQIRNCPPVFNSLTLQDREYLRSLVHEPTRF
jgi:Zn-dependent peptidase ImmA (M78 family)